MSAWATLSKIDVSEHIEKKNGLTYLSWAWAWGVLMKHYPEAAYEMLPDEVHADSSVTVHTALTVDGIRHAMWLPAMGLKNNALINPSSTDINKARMRCLTKNIAMFGLGHYIYAGEDLPEPEQEKTYPQWVEEYQSQITAIKTGIANDDLVSAAAAWFGLPDDAKMAIWKAPTKGGCFSTKEREVIRTPDFRAAHYGEKDSDI